MKALVLEGGGTKGSYEVGAYQALVECGYKFDCVIGASIGAFNGAMIVSGKLKELKQFWEEVNVGSILGLSDSTIEAINDKRINLDMLKDVVDIIKNKGIDLDKLISLLNELVDEDKVRHSKMNFGLVTVKRKNMEPVEIFIKDIPKDKLSEYINASCYLPGFKKIKLIDDEYYFDGGFHDVCPVNMALNAGYNDIVAIRVKGIGVFKKVESDTANILYLEPSRNLGSILCVNQDQMVENIKMGYYDTMRVLKNLDGYCFTFNKKPLRFYKFIMRKIPNMEYRRVKAYFNTTNEKDTIIKAIEYVLEKEYENYYETRDVKKTIRYIKKHFSYNDHFIYDFVCHLRFIFH